MTKNILLLGLLLVGISYADETKRIFKIGAGKDAGCTTKSEATLNERCRAAIKRFAIEDCIQNESKTKAIEVEGTYSWWYGNGGSCYSVSGYYVATHCSAYFECN